MFVSWDDIYELTGVDLKGSDSTLFSGKLEIRKNAKKKHNQSGL
jgi:hypothetical protein